MAIALKARRVVTTIMETTRGTFVAPNPTNDALPTVSEAEISALEPVIIDRKVLRQSLTKYPNIYPGVATATISVTCELGGNPNNPKTDYDTPNWGDLMRACGFQEVSNSTSLKPRLLLNAAMSGTDTAGTPIRHGQALVGNGATTPGAGNAIGDWFAEDDVLCVLETTAPVGAGLPALTWTQTIGGLTRIATGTRSAQAVVAFRLTSNVGAGGATQMETISMEEYLDGKRLQLKGCMGNLELQLDFGSTIKGKFDMQGIVVSPTTSGYADVAMPATPYELHKVAPTFLGKEVRVYEIGASPKGYGRDAAGFANVPGTPVVNGALSTVRINTGNQVILRRNALDASGISFALITDRSPSGSFDPDEVASSDFDWVTRFVAGNPMRFKAMVGQAGTVIPGGGAAGDGNTVDILAPGIVMRQMGDRDRDGINNWDGQFQITGGDYDPSASGELPGNDSELTIIYR